MECGEGHHRAVHPDRVQVGEQHTGLESPGAYPAAQWQGVPLSEVRLDKPIFTGDYFKEDVTAEYYPANRVEIPGVADVKRDGLIGLFSSGGWIPVGAYRVKGGRAWVENVEEGVIFQPLVVEKGRLRESGYPFAVRGGKAGCSVRTNRTVPLSRCRGNIR